MIDEGRRNGHSIPGLARLSLRGRAFAADRFVPVVTVLVVLLAIGGWLVMTTHVQPGTHVEEQTVLAFDRAATFDHRATVRVSNPVYDVGDVLQDRPIYFTAITPVLDGRFVYRYSSPHDQPITVTPELLVVLRLVDRGGESETVVWRLSRPIESGSAVQVSSGDVVTVPFSVNVSELERQRSRIEDDLGVVPGEVEALVVARVHERGRIADRPVATTAVRRLGIALRGDSYTVQQLGNTESVVRWTDEETVPNEYGLIRRLGSFLLVGVAGLGLLGLGGAGLTGRLDISPRQRRWLEFAQTRQEYDAWITTGRLPDVVTDRPTVEVDTFGELIDVAIYTDSRVIEDPRTDEYDVITDELVYSYRFDRLDDGNHPE